MQMCCSLKLDSLNVKNGCMTTRITLANVFVTVHHDEQLASDCTYMQLENIS